MPSPAQETAQQALYVRTFGDVRSHAELDSAFCRTRVSVEGHLALLQRGAQVRVKAWLKKLSVEVRRGEWAGRAARRAAARARQATTQTALARPPNRPPALPRRPPTLCGRRTATPTPACCWTSCGRGGWQSPFTPRRSAAPSPRCPSTRSTPSVPRAPGRPGLRPRSTSSSSRVHGGGSGRCSTSTSTSCRLPLAPCTSSTSTRGAAARCRQQQQLQHPQPRTRPSSAPLSSWTSTSGGARCGAPSTQQSSRTRQQRSGQAAPAIPRPSASLARACSCAARRLPRWTASSCRTWGGSQASWSCTQS